MGAMWMICSLMCSVRMSWCVQCVVNEMARVCVWSVIVECVWSVNVWCLFGVGLLMVCACLAVGW